MTFPQVRLYLNSLVRRKQIEEETLMQAFGTDIPSFGLGRGSAMRDSDLPDFGLGHKEVKRN